jgi:CMP-N,N'-diacetyllegionaminic acid synthase
MNIVAIIIARGGSKGIPKKNIIDFCGKPLISWTIMQCLNSKKISSVWVSSDSKEILDISQRYGANIIQRPDKISGDSEASESAWAHAIKLINGLSNSEKVDYILAPQVTSPLRHSSDFSNAIERIVKKKADSLVSVAEVEDFFMWKKNDGENPNSINYDYRNRKPRQEIEATYLENGSFYIFKPKVLKDNNNRLGGKIELFEMDRYKMFQIDNHEDIELASVIMKGYGLSVV